MRSLCLLLTLSACIEDKGSDSAGDGLGLFSTDPTALEFGEVEIGDIGTADLTVSNEGGNAATISELFISGDTAFSLQTALTLPMHLSKGSSTVLTLAFAPEEVAEFNGSLGVAVEHVNGYGEVPLSGAGVAEGSDTADTGDDTGDDTGKDTDSGGTEAAMSVSRDEVDFGTVAVGDAASEALVLENTGSEDILLSDFSSDASVFAVEGDGFSLPAVLAVGQSRTAIITFSPADERSYSGTITLSTDPEAVGASITLRGAGEDACTVCAPELAVDTGGTDDHAMSFVELLIYGSTFSQPMTLSNLGDSPLTLSDITVSNDSVSTCGEFSTDWDGGSTALEAAETLEVEVTYTATDSCFDLPTTELDANILHILSDDPSEPDWAIALSATIL